MLRGINIINFFIDNKYTRWNNTDVRDFIVILKEKKIPPFFLFLKTEIGEFYAELIDVESNTLIYSFEISVDIINDDYKLLKFLGTEIVEELDYIPCYLQVVIKNNSNDNKLYSEVFSWINSLDNTNIQVFAISSHDLTMSDNFILPYSEIENAIEFGIYKNGISVACEVTEDGVEKPYGNLPIFNTLNIKNTIELNGTIDIIKFLFLLRIISTNGDVYLFINGVYVRIINIEVSIKDEVSFGDTIIINFTYSEENYISARNEI